MVLKAVLFATAVLATAGLIASPKRTTNRQATAAAVQCCEFPPPPPDCPPTCGTPKSE